MKYFYDSARQSVLSLSAAVLLIPLIAHASIAATLTASSTELVFGHQTVGTTSAPQSVILTNTGNDPALISSVAVTGAMADDFAQSNNCGATLAVGSSCKVSVLFTPVSATAKVAALAINSNAEGSPTTVALTGAGIGTANLTVTPATLAFGHQATGTTSASKPVTLTNTGKVPVSLSEITVTGSMADDFPQSSNCGTSLAIGASCTINVLFAPVSSTAKSASLMIADNAAGSPQSVALSGAGVIAGGLTVSTNFLTFGLVTVGTTSAPRVITVSNASASSVAIKPITITGPGSAAFAQTTTCGTDVPAYGACTISVTFTGVAGVFSQAVLSIADAYVSTSYLVVLNGTGTSPPPIVTNVSPSILIVGHAATITLTGSGFDKSSTVVFNDTVLPTTVVSATELTATLPATAVSYPGSDQVQATVANSTQYSSPFIVTEVLLPTVSALSPATVTAGSASFTLTVTGTNFTQNSVISWGGQPLPTAYQYGSNQLSSTIGPALVSAAATVQVAVQSLSGSAAPMSNSLPFKITARPALALKAISPSTLTVGSPTLPLTILGQGFLPSAVVDLSGVPLATTYVSEAQLQAQIPASALASIGNLPVTIINSTGVNGTSGSIPLKVTAPMPDAVALQINTAHTGATSFQTLSFPTTSSWNLDVGGTPSYALIAEGKVIVTVDVNGNSRLFALDQATGAVIWGPKLIPGAANAVYDRGKIFVISSTLLEPATITAFDLSTGHSDWVSLAPAGNSFSSGLAARNGLLYSSGEGGTGTFFAINEGDGTIAWTHAVYGGDSSTPAVTDSGVYVTYPCQTYAADPATGTPLFNIDGNCSGGGAPIVANNVLYAPSGLGGFTGEAYNALDGTFLGNFTADVAPAFSATMGFYLQSKTLNGITLADDTVAWSFSGDGKLITSPLIINDAVIIGSSSGNVYALDAATGKLLWNVNTGGKLSPGTFSGNGIPQSGLAAGDGWLVVPAGVNVVTYKLSATPQ